MWIVHLNTEDKRGGRHASDIIQLSDEGITNLKAWLATATRKDTKASIYIKGTSESAVKAGTPRSGEYVAKFKRVSLKIDNVKVVGEA